MKLSILSFKYEPDSIYFIEESKKNNKSNLDLKNENHFSVFFFHQNFPNCYE